MRKLAKVALAVILFGLVCWIALLSGKPPEPSYQGKRLSQWLDVYNAATNMDDTKPAADAIRAMGTNCLPFLLAHIQRVHSPATRHLIYLLVVKQNLVSLPFYSIDPYQAVSIWAIKELGPIASPAIPQLTQMAGSANGDLAWRAATSLVGIGSNSIEALESICHSTNKYTRVRAVEMLARIRAEPDNFLSWGWGPDPLNHRRVMYVGLLFGDQDFNQVGIMLRNRDPVVRQAAIETIGSYSAWPAYSKDIAKTLPALKKCLSDEVPEVRAAATQTLILISAAANPADSADSKLSR